jgi:excisionase family DNA binding protein
MAATVMRKAIVDLMAKGTVTVKKATEEYGLGRSRLYELMMDGSLPYSQVGSRRLIPRVALDNLIAANLVGVEEEAGK